MFAPSQIGSFSTPAGSLLRSNIYSKRWGGSRICCLESCCVVGGSEREGPINSCVRVERSKINIKV